MIVQYVEGTIMHTCKHRYDRLRATDVFDSYFRLDFDDEADYQNYLGHLSHEGDAEGVYIDGEWRYF